MENVLYQATITPANESPDGESPEILYVTREVNGIAVILYDWDGTTMLEWHPTWSNPNSIIENAVDKARALRNCRERDKREKAAKVAA